MLNTYGDIHMTKLTSLILGACVAFASIGLAHADSAVAGAWKLSVGVNDAPCTLTLSQDMTGAGGTVAYGQDCPGGLNSVSAWKTSGNGIQLLSGSGELIAWLNPKGDSYVGNRITDGRKLALSR
jgi:hypothetical protein